jgi:hypothetical protein
MSVRRAVFFEHDLFWRACARSGTGGTTEGE